MVTGQTRWALGLSAALLATVGLLALAPSPDPTDPEGDDVPLWQVAPDTIVSVTIDRELPPVGTMGETRERRDLRLVLRGERWELVEPYEALADEDAVQSLFRLLASQRGQPVDGALDPEEYGLGDPPLARVTVQTESGLERHLWVGLKVPTAHRTYVRVPDGPVLTVAGDAHALLTARMETFRDHRMVHVDPAEVRHVELFGPEGRLVITGEGRSWSLEGWGRADPGAVDDVVMGLLDLRYDLIWEQDTWVEQPRFGAVVTEEGGETVRLHVGDETPMGVVASTSDGRYGVMFGELVAQLGRGPTSVLDPSALPLDLDWAERVKVEADGMSAEARRNGSAWSIPGIDDVMAWQRVQALAQAEAVYRRDLPEGPFDRGVVEVEEESVTHRLLLGPVVDGLRAVKDEAHPWPYRMREEDLQAFVGATR